MAPTEYLAELYDLILNYGFKIKVVKKYKSGNYDLEVYKKDVSKRYRVGPDFLCIAISDEYNGGLIISKVAINEKKNKMRII